MTMISQSTGCVWVPKQRSALSMHTQGCSMIHNHVWRMVISSLAHFHMEVFDIEVCTRTFSQDVAPRRFFCLKGCLAWMTLIDTTAYEIPCQHSSDRRRSSLPPVLP
jgi:hypothetical protein